MRWLQLLLLYVTGSALAVKELLMTPSDEEQALASAIRRRSVTLNHAAFTNWSTLLDSWQKLLPNPCFVVNYNHTVNLSRSKALINVDIVVSACDGLSSPVSDSLTVTTAQNITLTLLISQLKSEQPASTRHVSELNMDTSPHLRRVTNATLGNKSANWVLKSAKEIQTTYNPPCQFFLVAASSQKPFEAKLVWHQDTAHYTYKARRRHQFHMGLLEPPHTLHSIIAYYDAFLPLAPSSASPSVICSESTPSTIACTSPIVLSSHSWQSQSVERRLGSSEATVQNGLKILSYNVWNFDSGPHWDRRLPGLAKIIREENPDIVGLQEIRHRFSDGSNQLNQLQALLPEYQHHFQEAQVESTQEEGLGFLSKYPLLNISYSKLPITQSADLTQRICLHAAIQYGSSYLSFFVTHLAFVALPQLRQAGAVMKYMNSIRDSLHYPQAIVGDWNFYPESPEIHDYLVGNNRITDPEYPPLGDLTEAFQPFDTWPTWEPLENRPDRIYFRNSIAPNCSLPGDAACWAKMNKVFANMTYRAGFTKEPRNRNAVESDHLAVITTLQTCGIGYTYSYDASLTIPRNRTTFGPLAGVSGCSPVCIQGCPGNASCVQPDVCRCDQGYRLGDNGTCVMDCGCRGHGVCISPTECACDPGYFFDLDQGCKQLCPSGCGLHSECIANYTCACSAGYMLVDQTCQPLCPQCGAHSFCAEPGICACEIGFGKNGTLCIPVCEPLCGSYSTCIAPNVCRSELGLIVFLLLFGCSGLLCLLLKVCLRGKKRNEYMPVAGLEFSQLAMHAPT